ncbi:MAG: TIGR03013 family PEP-CTERM/XrtA system glycosyltransferase [Nitrospiraceae bacterium]|nr:TIGR03013 family PEP-CTERM/XrtA system glycosyltransferase [Nitrospiraceae bacterium]
MSKRLLLLFSGDVCLALFAAYSGSLLGFGRVLTNGAGYVLSWKQAAFFLAMMIFASYLAEFYSVESTTKRVILLKSMMIFTISMFTLAFFYIMAPSFMAGRMLNVVSAAFFCALQFFWHLSFNALLQISRFASKVLVVGTGPLANKIGGVITDGSKGKHVLQGYYRCSNEPVEVPFEAIVKNGDGLRAAVQKEKAHKIVISVSDRRGTLPVDDILHCKFSGIEVVDAPSFYEEMTGKLLIENLRPSWFIFSDGFRITPALKFFKRASDIFFAVMGLLLSAPLMPFIILAIKTDSRGPVLFRQVRVGEKERQFTIYKFRTMCAGAEKGTGAVWASENDPRVTRVGQFLRKSRLDEIMQLFNVLKGDMSFVGPRPERPEFVKELKKVIPYYSERHFVRPGLTGWAQVRFPYGASIEDAIEKLRYDLYYVKNMSFFLDLYIILETVKVILFERGSR